MIALLPPPLYLRKFLHPMIVCLFFYLFSLHLHSVTSTFSLLIFFYPSVVPPKPTTFTSLYLTLPYPTTPYLTLPYHTLPYLTLPYLTLPYLTLPYLTLPYLSSPYLTLPYLTLPYHTIPYHTLVHPTLPYVNFPCLLYLSLPYLILPYHTLPYFTLLYLTTPYLFLFYQTDLVMLHLGVRAGTRIRKGIRIRTWMKKVRGRETILIIQRAKR